MRSAGMRWTIPTGAARWCCRSVAPPEATGVSGLGEKKLATYGEGVLEVLAGLGDTAPAAAPEPQPRASEGWSSRWQIFVARTERRWSQRRARSPQVVQHCGNTIARPP
ncbi:hypothetical protein EAO74_11970 [Streptomyces sp. gb1(2016)]|uniref:HRDC domain-containing protein n=1 Tax=Streptomyces sp. gb1(2016) TaxID=1828321 RepID=A0A652KSW0_9ACTN|nr:hypothetical protein EAO74_11970 [Streptomyces sp. gb1(2016)]